MIENNQRWKRIRLIIEWFDMKQARNIQYEIWVEEWHMSYGYNASTLFKRIISGILTNWQHSIHGILLRVHLLLLSWMITGKDHLVRNDDGTFDCSLLIWTIAPNTRFRNWIGTHLESLATAVTAEEHHNLLACCLFRLDSIMSYLMLFWIHTL